MMRRAVSRRADGYVGDVDEVMAGHEAVVILSTPRESQDVVRDDRDGAGISDHVWSAEEIARLAD
jgi:hypothetical protein